MNLKEYLNQNEVLEALPDTFSGMVASHETISMCGCLALWHDYIKIMERYGFKSAFTPLKMFEYYTYQRQCRKENIKSVMRVWWLEKNNNAGKTNGELLNDEVEKFFNENKGEMQAKGVKRLGAIEFAALFENVRINEPDLDFYDFFNHKHKTFIRHIDLARVKNMPLMGSRRSIKNKFGKHFYLVEEHIENIYKRYYESHMFDGKQWDTYIKDIVIDKIAEGCLV